MQQHAAVSWVSWVSWAIIRHKGCSHMYMPVFQGSWPGQQSWLHKRLVPLYSHAQQHLFRRSMCVGRVYGMGWLDLVFVSKAVTLRCVLVMLVDVCAVTFALSCMIASGKPRLELIVLRTHVNRFYALQFAMWLHTTVCKMKRLCGMIA